MMKLILFLSAAILFIWRLLAAFKKRGPINNPKKQLLVVLGSGGHTTEMIYELETLDKSKYEFVFVVAATDKGSAGKAKKFMGTDACDLRLVPRAREVGQSYITSVATTLIAFVSSVKVVMSVRPDIILTNGPGTCIPIIVAGYILRFIGYRCSIMYSESLACVSHLSVSGRLAYYLADCFLVQWASLRTHYPRSIYAGRVPEDRTKSLPVVTAGGGDGTAIVTVGSTQFDELIKACDDRCFLKTLKDMGIKKIIIQHGSGKYVVSNIAGCCEVMKFSPELPSIVRTASLVISHAGAGTILDCLLNDVRMIVVPNENLMANHQVQLATALAEHGLLQWSRTSDLLNELQLKGTRPRTEFPKTPTPVFRSCVEDL
eukprot:TRINITY_DN15108_c0_g1_i1.p1 TRINITY_DN15108_c0_g1~~TRINITY_DN15108_c0_g1_i1.p1  ORF type:complete len:374 (+),score=58.45 TRINITY_DN15108_c0_g1_i1:94-1215(+)